MGTDNSSRNAETWARIKKKGIDIQIKACVHGNCNLDSIKKWFDTDCIEAFVGLCLEGHLIELSEAERLIAHLLAIEGKCPRKAYKALDVLRG